MSALRDFLFYEEPRIQLYCGDCREVLPLLEKRAEIIVTDPVWPNASPALRAADDPFGLFAEAAKLFPALANRLVVHLGCDSDPRFLHAIPAELPFFRVCWLEYVRPTYKGRLLYTGDVAYIFGTPPKSRAGRRVLSGRYISTRADAERIKVTKHKEWGKPVPGLHPAPRRFQHVRWIVAKFADGLVLDPFAGSGTTLLAAKSEGFSAIGIEIEAKWCEIVVHRLRQEVLL